MAPVHHVSSLDLRWADLDLLGHVNNVRYADYLREARTDLFRAAGLDPAGSGEVRRHELTFRAPLMFGRAPVAIESWASAIDEDGVTLEHRVRDQVEPGVTYLRARSRVAMDAVQGERLAAYLERGPRGTHEPVGVVRAEPRRHYPVQLRVGDLDGSGHASDVAFVEFFQEARIAFFDKALDGELASAEVRWVVAQTDVDYLAPLAPRAGGHHCHTRLVRLGTKSLTVESVVSDADGVRYATARVVMVVFDPVANRSVEPPERYRELLGTLVEID